MSTFQAAQGTMKDPGVIFSEPTQTVAESDRGWAIAMHLSLFSAQFVPVVLALILWLAKRHDSHFLDDHGKEAVNFQISLLIYAVAVLVLGSVFCLPLLLLAPIYILGLVGMIMGSVSAGKGQYYRNPMCLRMIR